MSASSFRFVIFDSLSMCVWDQVIVTMSFVLESQRYSVFGTFENNLWTCDFSSRHFRKFRFNEFNIFFSNTCFVCCLLALLPHTFWHARTRKQTDAWVKLPCSHCWQESHPDLEWVESLQQCLHSQAVCYVGGLTCNINCTLYLPHDDKQ